MKSAPTNYHHSNAVKRKVITGKLIHTLNLYIRNKCFAHTHTHTHAHARARTRTRVSFFH